MKLSLSLSALLAPLAFVACAADPETSTSTSSDELSSTFNGDRNRSCAGGCEEGTVCDDVVHACVAEPGPPTVTFPISGALTSGKPVFGWARSKAAAESVVEVCRDLQCNDVVETFDADDRGSLAKALPRGTYFVRAWGVAKAADGHRIHGAVAKTREFRSNGRDVETTTALGWFSDFDLDGIADAKLEADRKGLFEPSTRDASPLLHGGGERAGAFPVPDMNGDGRTELAELRGSDSSSAKLVISSVARDGTIVETPFDIAGTAQILLLGDVDRDGYADLGAARPLADGVRLEVLYGGPGLVARRAAFDLRMPMEGTVVTKFMSITALGDFDGDGYPDVALGGLAESTASPWGPTIPRSDVFPSSSWADGSRFHVFRGGKVPFSETLAPLVREGEPMRGLVPVGDVDGDGFVDAISVDPRIGGLVAYEADAHMKDHWNLVGRGIRTGAAYVQYGGPLRRATSFSTPTYFREGPRAGWERIGRELPYTDPSRDVPLVRTATETRTREEFYFDVGVTAAGDVDGDGFADIAFSAQMMRQPGTMSGATWDTSSGDDYLRDYAVSTWGGAPSTWHQFAAFVDVRRGSTQGIATQATQRILSPTLESRPSLAGTCAFPAAVQARTNGVFVSERRDNLHTNPPSFTPFEGTYADVDGKLTVVK